MNKKLIHILTGLTVCLSWYGINAKEAQLKQQEGAIQEGFTPAVESTEEQATPAAPAEQAPSIEAVLEELTESSTPEENITEETAAEPFSEESTLIAGEEDASNEVASLTINVAQISEAFGHFIGKNLESPGFTFDVDAVIVGIRNAVAGQASPMDEEEYEKALSFIQEHAFEVLAQQNLEEANTFLKANAQNENVVEIEEGKVQYEVEEEGQGEPVAEAAAPLIQYTGRYLDGTVFGSSEEGGPISIPLDQTISGLSKAIVGMREGEARKIYIHPEEGYGTSSHLPPNSLLVFDVKVLKANMDTPSEELAQYEPTEDEYAETTH